MMLLQSISRRQTLAGVGLLVGVAGCSENGEQATGDSEGGSDDPATVGGDEEDDDVDSDDADEPSPDDEPEETQPEAEDNGDDGGPTVTFEPASEELASGEETSVAVVVNNATEGIGAYDITIGLTPADVASITAITEPRGDGPGAAAVSDDGTAAAAERALLSDAFAPGTEATIATIDVVGETSGTIELAFGEVIIGNNDGAAYSPLETESVTLDIT